MKPSTHVVTVLTDYKVPIIWGWIGVGTQQLAMSIDDALETENASLALSRTVTGSRVSNDEVYHQGPIQHGLLIADKDESGLTPYISRTSRLDPGDSHLISAICNIRGDEKRRGPSFNYARAFTYCHLVGTVHYSLSSTMDNIRHRNPCHGGKGTWTDEKTPATELRGDAAQTEAYCGLSQHKIYAYPEWSEIPAFIWIGMALSAALSLFLQWGTTGAAIIIAYLTPTQGLGCRSGGYLLYGVNATVSCFLLAVSSLFSHSAMLRYQREKQKLGGAASINRLPNVVDEGKGDLSHEGKEPIPITRMRHASNTSFSKSVPSGPAHTRSAWDRVPVRGLAAVTRYTGKTLGVVNALFLIAISLFELTGGYDNCWCKLDELGLGKAGWVTLFKTTSDLKQAASLPWAMGIALSIGVSLSSFGVFWAGM